LSLAPVEYAPAKNNGIGRKKVRRKDGEKIIMGRNEFLAESG